MSIAATSLGKSALLSALPPVWPQDPFPAIRRELSGRRSQLVVLDDDPTGTQTVHDIAVVTDWQRATLVAELRAARPGFYILTNSRSLAPADTVQLHRELGRNLRAAAAEASVSCTVVSRSDSTLRGHFPLETETLAAEIGPIDCTLVAPYFEAGGRITLDAIHYVAEGEHLTPAAETVFARDSTFGYRSSDLRLWVEEKSGGRIPASRVAHLPIRLIREGGPDVVARHLSGLMPGTVCVADAVAPRDIEILALGSLLAESRGFRLLGRTAASFVAARLGLAPRAPLNAADFAASPGSVGGLVVVGSYVPKTTAQLSRLRDSRRVELVELSVPAILNPASRAAAITGVAATMNLHLAADRLVVLATSRELVTGATAEASLAIVNSVSAALIETLHGLAQRPRFLIAKGGITSSDVATRGLGVRRAEVRGQILPGVPVWRLGPETRFPGLDYVVFPGNVGGDSALAEAVAKFSPSPAS